MMYSIGRMGFNKPVCNNRQYGSSTLNISHTKKDMVLLKPEHLENEHFQFLNNFGLQPHLIMDKKFADINTANPGPRTFYPTNYRIRAEHSSKTTGEHCKKSSRGHPESTSLQTCKNSDMVMDVKPENTMPSCPTAKKTKRQRCKRQGRTGNTHCEKNHKVKNVNKPWHKTSLKLEIMELEGGSPVEGEESPATPLGVKIETFEKISIPVNMVSVIAPIGGSSPCKLLNGCMVLQKSEPCRFRIPSECDSDDSFIVFENSSNSFDTDIMELDEFEYSSSMEDNDTQDDEGVCSLVSSLEEVWPNKRVRFADAKDLCEVHPMIQWSYAYQKARKGPWEQIALDRMRFQRRISYLEPTINIILDTQHRNKIYNERFLEGLHTCVPAISVSLAVAEKSNKFYMKLCLAKFPRCKSTYHMYRGINMLNRKMGLAATPTVDLSKNGDEYCISSNSTFKSFAIKFTPGVEFDQETPDGRKLKATISVDGLTLHEIQANPVDNKKVVIERIFSPEELVMILKVDDVVCKRVYKVVQ